MANNYFKFKQFTIYQDCCAMKVGTDGVLIGAWGAVGAETEADILDIGSGTGVVSLIAAQRNPNAKITAIEIDADSAMQSKENFDNSVFKNRMDVLNISLQDFVVQCPQKYKYILSNPPYFINSLKSDEKSRALARHTDSLPYDVLANSVAVLLDENGIFSAIFPYVEANIFIAIAATKGLYCHKKTEVRGRSNGQIKRVLLQFGFERTELFEDSLEIELEKRHEYSQKYIELTSPYYLNF